MMKILVTGGAGYLGSTLVPMLIARGHRVRVVDNLLYGGGSLLACVPDPNFEFMRGDIKDFNTVEAATEGMDAVVHLAAIVGDPACAKQPDLAQRVNVDASLQLFDSCRQHRIERLVFASTCSCYGTSMSSSDYVTEESELRPTSLYAETKVAVEAALLDAYCPTMPAPTILRFATLFGVSPRLRFDLTVNEFTKAILIDRKLLVYGEQRWRPYVHVRDAARAIVAVLDSKKEKIGGEIFNVGGTKENYQKGELVELIRNKIDGDVDIQYVRREEDLRDYRVSFDKITRELNFHITRTVEHGITEIISAIRSGIIDVGDNCDPNSSWRHQQ